MKSSIHCYANEMNTLSGIECTIHTDYILSRQFQDQIFLLKVCTGMLYDVTGKCHGMIYNIHT